MIRKLKKNGISTILSWVDSELFHSGEQGCAIDTHSSSSSIRAANPSLALSKRSHDHFALLSRMVVGNIFFVAESTDRLFNNSGNIVMRGRRPR